MSKQQWYYVRYAWQWKDDNETLVFHTPETINRFILFGHVKSVYTKDGQCIYDWWKEC